MELRPYLELERRRRRTLGARWALAFLALALLLSFPPARRAAAGLLDLLRMETIQVVPLSDRSLEQLRNLARTAGTEFSRFGQTTSSGGELSPPLPPAEAESRLGFALPLPSEVPEGFGPPVIRVRTPAEVRITLDVAAVNDFLRSAGARETLPSSLHGRTVGLRLEAQAVVEYPEAGVMIVRGPAPAWEGVGPEEAEALKRAVLSLPDLPPELKAQLAATGDLRGVLLLPAPAEAVREVQVRGRPGFFLCGSGESCPEGQGGILLWAEKGLVNAIGGRLGLPEVLRLASSLP